MSAETPFEAVLVQSFALAGRGTVLGVEITSGIVKAGDAVTVPCADGASRPVEVRSVEYIDGVRTLVGLIVDGIAPDEVALGGTIRAAV